MDGAQQECPAPLVPAKLQEAACVRQLPYLVLNLAKPAMVPLLQLRRVHMGGEALVKALEGQGELQAEPVEGHGLHPGLLKNVVGGGPDRGQIVDQGARPIENDVADHGRSVGGEQ